MGEFVQQLTAGRVVDAAEELSRVISDLSRIVVSPLVPDPVVTSQEEYDDYIRLLNTNLNQLSRVFRSGTVRQGAPLGGSAVEQVDKRNALEQLTQLNRYSVGLGVSQVANRVAEYLTPASLTQERLVELFHSKEAYKQFLKQNIFEAQLNQNQEVRIFIDEIINGTLVPAEQIDTANQLMTVLHAIFKAEALIRLNVTDGETFWGVYYENNQFRVGGLAPWLSAEARNNERRRLAAATFQAQNAPAVLEGSDAVNFLLQREQAVLAALNERIAGDFLSKRDTEQKNIIQMNNEQVPLLVNLLQKRVDLTPFFKIRTPLLSLIVPKIRLFKKVFAKSDGGGYEQVDLGRLEFQFSSFTNEAKIDKITQENFGRGDGVGIKSVNWVFNGTNPETVRSFVEFDISIFLQNLSDLIPPGMDDDIFFVERDTSLIQLIGAGVGARSSDTDRQFQFAITAQLGWELSSNVSEELADDQTLDQLRAAIGSTQTELDLRLFEHNINFNEDGTLSLDISYFAALDDFLSDQEAMNILTIGESPAIDSVLLAESIDEQEAQERLGSSAPSGQSSYDVEIDGCYIAGTTTSENSTEQSSGDADAPPPTRRDLALQDSLRAVHTSDESIYNNYENIFQRMLTGDPGTGQSKIYSLKINRETLAREIDGTRNSYLQNVGDTYSAAARDTQQALSSDPEVTQAEQGRRERGAQISRLRIVEEYFTVSALAGLSEGDLDVVLNGSLIGALPSAIGDGAAAAARDAARQTETLQESLTAIGNQNLRAGMEETIRQILSEDSEYYQINFFRLGDLIDTVIEGLKQEEGSYLNEYSDFFKFISGLYYYIEPLRGERRAINFCNILISVNSFRSFFIEKIIRPLRTTYDLKTFILDLVREFNLVRSIRLSSRNTRVRGEGRAAFSVFQASDISLEESIMDAAYQEEVAIVGKDAPGLRDVVATRRLQVDNNINLSAIIPGFSAGAAQDTAYLILQSTNFFVADRRTEAEDIARGIYHLKLGSDRGIVKKVNFRRDEIQGRREGRIARAGALNRSALREKYDVTITLFGAPFFLPGMYFYLDPSMVGLGFSGSLNSAARVFGLGGYYFINKVTNSISNDGGFETIIEASWNAFGDGFGTDGCPAGELEIISPQAAYENKEQQLGTDLVIRQGTGQVDANGNPIQ